MARPEDLLEAGALISTRVEVEDAALVDKVSARRYQHPALGERAVVRLVADNVAAGDDLAMEFYGFSAPDVTPELGQQRRRSMGFPAWALIHDPEHAHFALKVVKQLKRAARRARSKPGHAWDDIAGIADSMDRSVVHFLPSFWEEVGRVFIDVGSATYAGRAFGKAREAEKTHALEVDADHLREVFLEFALAGALTVKVLSSYAKDLESTLDAGEAWTVFRDLCVRRTLGGMPPWAGMPKEMRRLSKAAGLNEAEEEAAVLRDILGAEAMKRSQEKIWKSYSKTLKTLASEDAEVAGLLLNIKPSPAGMWGSFMNEWLGYLEQWDLIPNLWNDSGVAGPRGGFAAWFERALSPEPPERIFNILRQGAEKLRNDGRPVQFASNHWGNEYYDINLLDLALELEVPVADPPEEASIELHSWAHEDSDDQRRDPVYLAADPRFAKELPAAVAQFIGTEEFERAAAGMTAFAEFRRQWLDHVVSRLGNGGLPALENGLEEIRVRTSAGVFREFPEALPKLQNVDLTEILRRTLQSGVFDELGWPDFEEALEELFPAGVDLRSLKISGEAPYLALTDGARVLVLGPTGKLLDHELQVPAGGSLEDLRYLDGELLVRFSQNYEEFFYWSGNPKNVKEDRRRYTRLHAQGVVVPVPGGGSFRGDETIHAGGDYPSNGDVFFSDGQYFWRSAWDGEKKALRELEPATGRLGRQSLPSFFENYLKPGWEISLESSDLLFFGEGIEDSPLGSRDGLVGWRTRVEAQENDRLVFESEGIDGRTWNVLLADEIPVGLLQLPGALCPLTGSMTLEWRWYGGANLWDPSGTFELANLSKIGPYNAGQVAVLPPYYWHCFRVRDPEGSQALRDISDEVIQELLTGAETERASKDTFARTDVPDYIRDALPQVSDQRLLRGITGIVRHAADLKSQHERLFKERDISTKGAGESWGEQDESWLQEALGHVDIRAYYSIAKHWGAVSRFLGGEVSVADSRPLPEGSVEWFPLFGELVPRLWSALWLEEDVSWVVRFLRWWAEGPMSQLEGRMTLRTISSEGDGPFPASGEEYSRWFVGEFEGSRFVGAQDYGETWTMLEHVLEGEPCLPPRCTARSERELKPVWNVELLTRFADLLEQRGKPQITAELLKKVAVELDLNQAEAALIWTGFANVDSYRRDFLPQGLREALGLKVADVDLARKSLAHYTPLKRQELIAAMLDGEPEELWKGDAAVMDRLAAAHLRLSPKRLKISDVLLKEIIDIFDDTAAGRTLEALAVPDSHPWLTEDGEWELQQGDYSPSLVHRSGEERVFDSQAFRVLVELLPLFAHRLPVGDPARAAIAEAVTQGQQRLENPDLLVTLGSTWNSDEALLKSLFDEVEEVGAAQVGDDGVVVGMRQRDYMHFVVRPQGLADEHGLERARLVVDAAGLSISLLPLLEFWQDEGFQAIAERLVDTPLAEGEWEANPLLSAPEIVAEVCEKYSLDEDAAVLYLQILTLPDPTTANIKTWNGWKPARIKKAAAPLIEAELLIEAKRARAGRNYFLPGGWEALKAPLLPIETWKVPLYGLEGKEEGSVEPILSRILPLHPVHDLFAAAWQRIEDGDFPRYEEIS